MIWMHRNYEMGRSPAQLLADGISGWSEFAFSEGSNRQVVFTQSGRAAVALMARLWGLDHNDEVLLPAYNCGSEISPIIATGAQVSMYRIDAGARIDFEDLLRRITPRTRLVYVTHYFGRPEVISDLATYCRRRNIKLLEDCALSLFSEGAGQAGDAAIFSLRKSLPACDGGVLTLRDRDSLLPLLLANRREVGATVRSLLSLMKKWSKTLVVYPSTLERGNSSEDFAAPLEFPPLPATYYWSKDAAIYEPSFFSLGLLKRTDPREVVRQRRENYSHLRQRLGDNARLTFLWEGQTLLGGMCPLGLPMLVDHRRRWCNALNAAGIGVTPWWEGYHRGLDWSEFPEARALKSRLLLLPVHQGLTTRDMEYVAEVVLSLARSFANQAPNKEPHPIPTLADIDS